MTTELGPIAGGRRACAYAGAALLLLLLAGCGRAEAPVAAAKPEKVLFEDDHVRLVEVTNRSGENQLEAVAHSAVVFTDAAWPKVAETPATAAQADQRSAGVVPKDDGPYPSCFTQGPAAARVVTVQDDFPQHYYRLEYKRIDGKDYPANWKTWYAEVMGTPTKVVADLGKTLAGGKPQSAEWPFDPRYSATAAAPANHTVRYQDDHIEVIEVAIRPGETENMHGHPYRSVYADDGGFLPDGAVYKNATLGPDTGPPWGKMSSTPKGPFPNCFSAVPEAPHAVEVVEGAPQHFYRVHFKRVDGDGVKANWKTWYPAS
jgi:hypothetical protein